MSSVIFSISEDSLVCAICTFCCVGRDPRILPCQHTYCFDCIKRLANGKSFINCPSCREEFSIPNGDCNNIQKNILYGNIKKEIDGNGILCKIHQKEAMLFCLFHNKPYICIKCFEGDHMNCSVVTLKKKKQDLIKNREKEIEEMKKKISSELVIKEDLYVKRIKGKFKILRKQVKDRFAEEKKLLINLEKASLSYENFEEIIKRNKILDYHIKEIDLNCTIFNRYEDSIENNVNNDTCIEIDINNDLLRNSSFIAFRQANSTDKNLFLVFLKPKISSALKFIKTEKNLVKSFYMKSLKFTVFEYLDLYNSLLNLSLTEIHLEDCNLTEETCDGLGLVLQRSSNIQLLNLCRNELLSKGLSNIIFGLSNSFQSLKSLDLSGCNLTQDNFDLVRETLSICSKIECLNFSFNNLQGENFEHLCKVLLKMSGSLKKLSFRDCQITTWSAFMKLIGSSSKIEDIDISFNKLDDMFVSSLSNCSSGTKLSLKRINMCGCNLTQQGAIAFGKLIGKCTKLEELNMLLNPEMKSGMCCLLKNLKQSSNSVKEIFFDLHNLPTAECPIIERFLINCKELNKIYLSYKEEQSDNSRNIFNNLFSSLKNLKEWKIIRYDDFNDKMNFQNLEKKIYSSY